MQEIALIGSTGSIGTQALDVVRAFPQFFRVSALTAHRNLDRLKAQADLFHPRVVGISDANLYAQAKMLFPNVQLFMGEDAHELALEASGASIACIAVVGFAGLKPLLKCIDLGQKACVANKESIVCGGAAVRKKLQEKNAQIYPVDSEHSAIFQCLQGEKSDFRRILLTCSGGPFRTWKKEDIAKATVQQALQHPKWNMGRKITIDSATLANKGLEVLEARWLFDAQLNQIDVLIHPQSIVHSMVEYKDRSVLAQLGNPDMRLPIQYAFGYPERLPDGPEPLDFVSLGTLTFEKPDMDRFPCLALAYEAGKLGGIAPIAFNAANDLAVEAFIKGQLSFYQISDIIERALRYFGGGEEPDVDTIFAIDAQARAYIQTIL